MNKPFKLGAFLNQHTKFESCPQTLKELISTNEHQMHLLCLYKNVQKSFEAIAENF